MQVEDDLNINIKTAEDAIWWSYVTITTVGYVDKFPVTTERRLIAAFLMTPGVGLFRTSTGFVASWFVAEKKHKAKSIDQKCVIDSSYLKQPNTWKYIWEQVSAPCIITFYSAKVGFASCFSQGQVDHD